MLFKAEIKRCKGCQHFGTVPTRIHVGFKFVCSHKNTCNNYNEFQPKPPTSLPNVPPPPPPPMAPDERNLLS